MKISTKAFTSLFLMMIFYSMQAYAQFEGQISMNLYEQENGTITDTNELNLFATSNRILIKGEDKINISDGLMEASGFLVRGDMQDFVVMMGEDEALRFTKEELEGVFNMLSMFDDGEHDLDMESDNEFKYTNEVRTIQGLKATELQVWDDDNDGYLSIWLTNELDINWNILTQPWSNVPKGLKKPLDQMTQEFKSSNFPLLIEVHDKNKDYTLFEVTKVKKSRIAKDMVEVPANIQLVSLQTMLMKAMMSN